MACKFLNTLTGAELISRSKLLHNPEKRQSDTTYCIIEKNKKSWSTQKFQPYILWIREIDGHCLTQPVAHWKLCFVRPTYWYFDSDLNVRPNNLQNEDDENTTESNDSDTGPTDSDSDTNELFSNGESANKSKKAKLIRQFSIHQQTGPVTSFPLQKVDHHIPSSLVYNYC